MTKFKSATLLTASALLFAATSAHAGDQNITVDAKSEKTANMSQEMETSETAAPTSAIVTFTKTSEDPRVLGAIARGDMVKVQDSRGDVYLNRFVPVAELPDPELDVDTVESYTYEYNGRVYTNKVVNEK